MNYKWEEFKNYKIGTRYLGLKLKHASLQRKLHHYNVIIWQFNNYVGNTVFQLDWNKSSGLLPVVSKYITV
jgi:hypothetical protein